MPENRGLKVDDPLAVGPEPANRHPGAGAAGSGRVSRTMAVAPDRRTFQVRIEAYDRDTVDGYDSGDVSQVDLIDRAVDAVGRRETRHRLAGQQRANVRAIRALELKPTQAKSLTICGTTHSVREAPVLLTFSSSLAYSLCSSSE